MSNQERRSNTDKSASTDNSVNGFVNSVKQRVNGHRLLTTAIWATVFGAFTLIAIGLFYVIPGYSVPVVWTAGIAAATLLCGVVAWVLQRLDVDHAARLADDHFSLKDTISSFLHFNRQGKSGGYYSLQAKQTESTVKPLNHRDIKYKTPQRGVLLAMGLLAVAIPISLRGPSDHIKEKIRLEENMLAQTSQIKDDLKQLIEELEKGIDDPDEKELLKPDELRKMVDELKSTKDQKEALRQFAQLERKLNKARLAVQRKKEEQLVAKVAKELKKGEQTKQLGEKLEQKKFEQAAKDLEKLKPEKLGAKKDISKQRRDLARLKAAAQRMAAAARAGRKNKSSSGNKSGKSGKNSANANRNSNSSSKNGKSSESGSGDSNSGEEGEMGEVSDEEGIEMAEDMEELEQAIKDLEKMLEEAELQEIQLGECDDEMFGECENCRICVGKKLNDLSNNFKRLAVARKCDSKLKKLCKSVSQCQNSLALMRMRGKGGLKAGWGADDTRRKETDELVDNGMTTQLKGQKGQGPSLTRIEAADEGTGVSHRRSEKVNREFKRQYESFVQREDVPEQVKSGVKNYFEMIHQFEDDGEESQNADMENE